MRAACIGADLLRFAEETSPYTEGLLATRKSRLEEAEARLADADAAYNALRTEISERGAMHDDPELEARFWRLQTALRDAQNDVQYARSDWEEVEVQAGEADAYLELVALHAAALAYTDSAANFARGTEDSLRYAGLSESKEQEAESLGSTRRALEARFRAAYGQAHADEFSKCNLLADELSQQGRS